MRTRKRSSMTGILPILLSFLLATLLFAQNETTDPVEVSFDSNGDKIHGWFYRAQGKGPFPTVVLLHGFPGGDGDLFGLGQHLAGEGFNALTFNYSGTWKSEGIFLPKTSLENVKSALDFLRSEQSIRAFAVDTSNIALVGYSYGGGFALLGSLQNRSVQKVVSIAGGDLSVVAKMIEESPSFRQSHQQFMDQCMADSTVARGLGGSGSHEWLLKYRADYDLKKCADRLASKDILLIGGWLDHTITIEDHVLPLYRALQEQEAARLEIIAFETDHSFKNARTELISKIISWLRK